MSKIHTKIIEITDRIKDRRKGRRKNRRKDTRKDNSRGKKSGRATYFSDILKKWVNFGLVGHVSLLVDYSFWISTYICISQYF